MRDQQQPGSIDDIQESSLGQVSSALLGGLGRPGVFGACDPNSSTFLTCASFNLTPPAPSRVLVIARTRVRGVLNTNASGQCALATNPGGTVPNTLVPAAPDPGFTLVGVNNVLPAGATVFALDCNESSTDVD